MQAMILGMLECTIKLAVSESIQNCTCFSSSVILKSRKDIYLVTECICFIIPLVQSSEANQVPTVLIPAYMFSKIANPCLNEFLQYVRLSGKMLIKVPKRKIALQRKCKARVALVHDPAYWNILLVYPVLLNIILLSFEVSHVGLLFL